MFKLRHIVIPVALVMIMPSAIVLAQAPTTQPVPGYVRFSGNVVDDETGEPITAFATQMGVRGPTDDAMRFGFSSTSTSNRREGQFQQQFGMNAGSKVALRFFAAGYMPQVAPAEPVTLVAGTPEQAQRIDNIVVRLKRGGELKGTITDHLGNAVANAKVFVAGGFPLQIENGESQFFEGTNTTTDAEGAFTLTGLGGSPDEHIVVLAHGQSSIVAMPAEGEPLKVELPEPARLIINYDIPGTPARNELRIELKTWEKPEWRNINIVHKPTIDNPGQLELGNLAPGSYDFTRPVTMRVGDSGRGYLSDRRTVVLLPGQTRMVDLDRSKGYSIEGTVTGLKEGGTVGAYISIRGPGATGDMRSRADADRQIFDGTTCSAEDGKFKTAALLPGKYTVVAEAYAPETPSQMGMSGIRLPTLLATVEVTVPADKAPEPITIEMNPLPPRE